MMKNEPVLPRTVPETRIGVWFQSSRIWNDYVLLPALEELWRLAAGTIASNPVVLDAGCGHGVGVEWVATKAAPSKLYAVDEDQALVETAKRRAGMLGIDAEIRCMSVCRLDLPDNSVDLVICHQTLHHVTDQESALREFRRVLRPHGVLLLAESCWPFLRRLPVRLFFRHPPSARRIADDYLSLLKRHHFVVDPARVSFPRPFWTLARPSQGAGASVDSPLCHAVAVRSEGDETGDRT